MSEHTPTPWCIPDGEDNESLVCQQIDGRCGIVIFGTADKFRSWQRRIEYTEQNANAAFIVKAVNSHAALVEALTKSRQWVEANTAQVRGISAQAAAPGEAMLSEIDAALASIKDDRNA